MAKEPTHAPDSFPGYGPAPSPGWQTLPPSMRQQEAATAKKYRAIRIGLFAYFWLLVFEGALRKWFLPGLATPLLILRDPLALGLLLMAARRGVFPVSNYVTSLLLLGTVSLVTAVLLGHGSLIVAAYGARTLLVHLPLMFLIGRVMGPRDVVRIGKWTLLVSVPMVLLIVLQFYSPQSAWVNRGVGGDETGAGFGGALGYFRPPGTFSFTNGNSLFFGLCAAYIGFFWIKAKQIDVRLLIAATLSLLIALPFSISRTLLFETALSLSFAVFLTTLRAEYSRRLPLLAAAIAIAITALAATPFFEKGVEVMTARFTSASRSEGGLAGTLGERFLGGMAAAVTEKADDSGVFGVGIGMGTNVGAQLTAGKRTFLVAEDEWQRTVGELGPILGLGVIVLRVLLSFDLLNKSYRKATVGDPLPWMLMSFGFLQVLNGGTAQPTALGFVVVTGGLVLASLNQQGIVGQGRKRSVSMVGAT